ncbi:hypothetical protein BESB_085180 [Besnoitia besnoiti]|uniref:N-alpha-acetyltransferase 60 n=1 Tax=Besnoitia besnoiti TaxID=94643 RepID=A0A2A9M5V4_BESBE|nr:hypothetical protein BESB_085180 [Besnoitia besnoiti]PFH33319.1 hypothetical protein BESB_085180 [Besnoitia besnoiti]
MSVPRVERSACYRPAEVADVDEERSQPVGAPDVSQGARHFSPSSGDHAAANAVYSAEAQHGGACVFRGNSAAAPLPLLPSSSSAIPPSSASRPHLTAPVHRFAREADLSQLPLGAVRFRPVKASDYWQLRQLHEELFPFKYEHAFFEFVCRGECFSLAAVVSREDLQRLPRLLGPSMQPRPSAEGEARAREFSASFRPRNSNAAPSSVGAVVTPAATQEHERGLGGVESPLAAYRSPSGPHARASEPTDASPPAFKAPGGVVPDGESTGERSLTHAGDTAPKYPDDVLPHEPAELRCKPSARRQDPREAPDVAREHSSDARDATDNGSRAQASTGGTQERNPHCAEDEPDEFVVGIITVSQRCAHIRAHEMNCLRKWYRWKHECAREASPASSTAVSPADCDEKKPVCCSHAAGLRGRLRSATMRHQGADAAREHGGSEHLRDSCGTGTHPSMRERSDELRDGSGNGSTGEKHLTAFPSEEATSLIFPNLQADESVADLAYILTLGVAEEFRQKGVAQELIQRTLTYFACPCANRLPTQVIFLHVVDYNHAAVHFYEKQKFECLDHTKDFYHIYGALHGAFLYAFNLAALKSRCECAARAPAKCPLRFSSTEAAGEHAHRNVQWGLAGVQNVFRKVGETLVHLWSFPNHAKGVDPADARAGGGILYEDGLRSCPGQQEDGNEHMQRDAGGRARSA